MGGPAVARPDEPLLPVETVCGGQLRRQAADSPGPRTVRHHSLERGGSRAVHRGEDTGRLSRRRRRHHRLCQQYENYSPITEGSEQGEVDPFRRSHSCHVDYCPVLCHANDLLQSRMETLHLIFLLTMPRRTRVS